MNVVIDDRKAVDYICLIAICCFFARAIVGDYRYLLVGAFLGCCIFLYQVAIGFKFSQIAFVSLILVIISYPITFAHNGLSSGVLFIPLFIGSFGVAWRIGTSGISYTFCRLIFYGSVSYFVLLVVVNGDSVGSVFAHSRNHVSVYFINAVCLLYIGEFLAGHKLKVFPAFLVFLISVLSIGIGGIISSFVLFCLMLYHKYVWGCKGYEKALFLSCIVFLFTLSSVGSLLENFNLTEGDLQYKVRNFLNFSDNSRYLITKEFFDKFGSVGVVFGSKIGQEIYGLVNLHSAYLLLINRIGIFGVILMLIFLHSLYKLMRTNYLYFLLFFSILFRGLTDTTFLAGSPFDFILLYFLGSTHFRHIARCS
jgi:hypothetical protein